MGALTSWLFLGYMIMRREIIFLALRKCFLYLTSFWTDYSFGGKVEGKKEMQGSINLSLKLRHIFDSARGGLLTSF
jgi:hypothetical protein